jgi:UPF0755 protein
MNNISKFAVRFQAMKSKGLIYLLSGLTCIVVIGIILIYRTMFGPNIRPAREGISIYIPTGASYNQVIDTLHSKGLVSDLKILNFIAQKKKYPSRVKPGRYVINKNISYIDLVDLLRSGNQTPVKVTFNHIRTLNDIAGRIGHQIEADSSRIISFLSDQSNYRSDGFTRENVISVFIPDTYEFFWNTDARGLYNRMLMEYRKFWNDQRLAKAKEKKLDPVQVTILASIIDDEVAKADEKPRIAGVYLNRIRRGMPLQACPTIKFALNDFTITRVLNKYLLVDSPYNTYKNKGFPPGPIGCPTIEGIDAVLNAENHDFLFFAAKPDFTGYHNFSKTLSEHNHNAALYQLELDRRKIFR